MPFGGTVAEALQMKQSQLDFYIQAQQAFASGAQRYKIGNREMQYIEPDKLQPIIDKLMAEITMLANGGRRSFSVIPRDI